MASKEAISKDTTIGELVQRHPEAALLMIERGMHCIGCGMAASETIEQGCRAHGMSDRDISRLIEDMNKAVAESEKDEDLEGENK